jgi:hypothetical protein
VSFPWCHFWHFFPPGVAFLFAAQFAPLSLCGVSATPCLGSDSAAGGARRDAPPAALASLRLELFKPPPSINRTRASPFSKGRARPGSNVLLPHMSSLVHTALHSFITTSLSHLVSRTPYCCSLRSVAFALPLSPCCWHRCCSAPPVASVQVLPQPQHQPCSKHKVPS